MSKLPSGHPGRPPSTRRPGVSVLAAALGLVGLAVVLVLAQLSERPEPRPRTASAEAAGDPSSPDGPPSPDARVRRIASLYVCPCGKCGAMSLAECSCDMPGGAREAKAEIASLIAAGRSDVEIVESLGARWSAR